MSAQHNLILVTRDGWQLLRDGQLVPSTEWPTLEAPTLVVTDFEEAPIASYRFDSGKPSYAVPMIEKRARAEGVVDGLAHILTHRVQSVRNGFQTFHTVVPLEFWQHLQQWAAQQRDHCIIVPLGALLESGVGAGKGRVLRLGRAFHFFGRSNAGLFYASSSAVGSSDTNLLAAVRVLAGATRAEIDRGIDDPIEWGSVLAVDAEQDARLMEQWKSLSPLPAVALPVEAWRIGETRCVSALPGLLERPGVHAGVNPPLARMAWMSERIVAGVATVTAIVALGLLGLGYYVRGQAEQEQARADESRRAALPLEARVAAANAMQTPPGFAPVAEFAVQLGDGLRYDPVPMLGLLRASAGADMRIQRLRLEGAEIIEIVSGAAAL